MPSALNEADRTTVVSAVAPSTQVLTARPDDSSGFSRAAQQLEARAPQDRPNGGPKQTQENWISLLRHKVSLSVLAGVLLLTLGICFTAVKSLGVPRDDVVVVACGYPVVAVFYALWVSWSRSR